MTMKSLKVTRYEVRVSSHSHIWGTITGGKLKCYHLFNQPSIHLTAVTDGSFLHFGRRLQTVWRIDARTLSWQQQRATHQIPWPAYHAILCYLSLTKNTLSAISEHVELGSLNWFFNLSLICTFIYERAEQPIARKIRISESAAGMAPLGRRITQKRPGSAGILKYFNNGFQLTLLTVETGKQNISFTNTAKSTE